MAKGYLAVEAHLSFYRDLEVISMDRISRRRETAHIGRSIKNELTDCRVARDGLASLLADVIHASLCRMKSLLRGFLGVGL